VAETAPILSVRDLRVRFGTSRGPVYAVNGISFDIAPGETLGIVGESGCGKSVSALAMLGILARNGRVTGGSVTFGDRDLVRLSDRALRDVRGKLREVLQTHFGMRKREALERAGELLDRVGIPSASSRLGDYPHQFSGGMRQRAMIAMALACEPKLLIADEPTTAST